MRLNPKITLRRKSWNADKLKPAAKKEAARRLNLAAQAIRTFFVQFLSTPYPPASRPGEAPHARTGRLRNSFVAPPVDPNELVARVGTTVVYAPMLEKGTSKMAARPYVERVLKAARPVVTRILTYRGGSK